MQNVRCERTRFEGLRERADTLCTYKYVSDKQVAHSIRTSKEFRALESATYVLGYKIDIRRLSHSHEGHRYSSAGCSASSAQAPKGGR